MRESDKSCIHHVMKSDLKFLMEEIRELVVYK